MSAIAISLLFGLAGVTAVAWNAVWLWRNYRLLFVSARTIGTVARLDIHDEHLRDRGTTYRYVVCYQAGGQDFVIPAVPAKAFAVGERVTVRYLPEEPRTALAGWLPGRLFGPAFMTAWGMTVILVAFRMRP